MLGVVFSKRLLLLRRVSVAMFAAGFSKRLLLLLLLVEDVLESSILVR